MRPNESQTMKTKLALAATLCAFALFVLDTLRIAAGA